MNEVKRFKPVINSAPYKPYAYCEENEDGIYVRIFDYEALKAERDALAAENVALINAHPQPFGPIMMQALDAYEKDREQEPETGMLNAFFILRDSINIQTPATDAHLNAVRADGVDKAIAHLHKKFEGTGHIGVPVMALESLANQLRAGKDGE